MKTKQPWSKRKKRIAFAAAGVVVLLAAVLVWLLWPHTQETADSDVPRLVIETPQKRSSSDRAPFTLDVRLSDLGEARYPAASLSIRFDTSHLTFLGVEEGNVMTLGGTEADQTDSTVSRLPAWSVNTTRCNETGLINVMYLDATGGKFAFSRGLLTGEDDVLLRLSFSLRGSARAGDVYALTVEDAVFAASDSAQSLSTLQQTLQTVNSRIVLEE